MLEQIRALPGTVWILVLGLFVHRFGTFVVPFLTLYLTDLGYTTGRIGIVFAAMAVGGVIAMFLGGRLADLIGRSRTMAISLAGMAVAMILMWQADSFIAFTISSFLLGITSSMYHPAANSLLVDLVPEARRVTAFAVVRWAVNIGFAAGMAAGGILAEKNFAYLFLGDAISSIVFAGISLWMLPQGIRTSRAKSKWAPALRHILGNKPFIAYFVALGLSVSTFFIWGSSVAKFTTDLGYSKEIYGWIMAANGLLIAICELGISQITRKRNAQRVIALGFFLCGAGVWINGFAHSWVVILIALIVFTFGEMIALPVASAYMAALAPDEMRGRYTAVIGLTWNVGHGIAPWLGLTLYEHQPSLLWWGCLAAGIASAATMLLPLRTKNST